MSKEKQNQMKKQKMSNFAFRCIFIPIMVLMIVLTAAADIVLGMFHTSIDSFMGTGEITISNPKGTSGWDTEYYKTLYASGDEAREAATLVAKQLADEGIVLLKNDGALPLSGDTAVTPMGYCYLSPIYGGTGSGNVNTEADYVITPEKGLAAVFSNINTTVADAMKSADAQANPPAGEKADNGSVGYQGASTTLWEYDRDVYENASDSMSGTVGIVYLGRAGGEGGDLCATTYSDGTRHELALTAAEKDMIAVAKENCDSVVIVLETSNAMEVAELEDDPDVSAVLLMGGAGNVGFASLSEILSGAVNPSGRLTDIYVADFMNDPTYANFDQKDGSMNYENTAELASHIQDKDTGDTLGFHEYEEGVYVGYKYYETSSSLGYFTSTNLPAGETDPYYNRDNGVVYPFGYGLSYTTFEQEITDYSDTNGNINITVHVENTGDTAGKDTVQIYYNPPYTDFDIENRIEKPTVNLIAFGKTGMLDPGASEDVVLTFAAEDMASYCSVHDNGDGTVGCYVLEDGDYEITLRSNSHSVIDTRTYSQSETVWYDNSNPRSSDLIAATNQFDDSNDYMYDDTISGATVLTRADWAGTQPSAPTEADRTASDKVMELLTWNTSEFDYQNDPLLGDVEGSLVYTETAPASKEKNNLTLASMRGVDYDDPLWDSYLNQLDYSNTEEISGAVFHGAYNTGAITELGKPSTLDKDGPQGIAQLGAGGGSSSCAYPSEPVVAQTWNTDLAYDFGASVGQEALAVGLNTWYAPGANLHRSPFGGRNYEYFSEDSILSGRMTAAEISGTGDQGLVTALKHFAMNDQENQRGIYLSVWATEQTIRETYMKPFEIAVKTATKTISYISDAQGTVSTKTMPATDGMMSAFASIGGTFIGWNRNITENMLRGEWGYKGYIISDMNNGLNGSRLDKLQRGGVDVLMAFQGGRMCEDISSATGMNAYRKAVKNLSYAQANSAIVNNAAPGAMIKAGMAPWRYYQIILNVVLIGIAVLCLVLMILRTRDEKKNPDKYKNKKRANR